jgi:hypothetical protein
LRPDAKSFVELGSVSTPRVSDLDAGRLTLFGPLSSTSENLAWKALPPATETPFLSLLRSMAPLGASCPTPPVVDRALPTAA